MFGGYGEVDPCGMLLYIHWVHFMVEMSREAASHLQRPMSAQEVVIHYFLANPELQRKLSQIPYYGGVMVKKLLEMELRCFKSKHWKRINRDRDRVW